MSKQETTDTPNFMAQAYRSHTNEPERLAVAGPVLRSDKDNWTKTSLKNAFVMSVVDLDIAWANIEDEPPYKCTFRPDSCKLEFDDPEEYIGHAFEEVYRINMRNEDALSLTLFRDITSISDSRGAIMEQSNDKRMKEGVRK